MTNGNAVGLPQQPGDRVHQQPGPVANTISAADHNAATFGPLLNGPLSMLLANLALQAQGTGQSGSSQPGSEPKLTYNGTSHTFGTESQAPNQHGHHSNLSAHIPHPTFGALNNEAGIYEQLHSLLAQIPISHTGAGHGAPNQYGYHSGQAANIPSPAFSPEYNGQNYQGPQQASPFAFSGPVYNPMHNMQPSSTA